MLFALTITRFHGAAVAARVSRTLFPAGLISAPFSMNKIRYYTAAQTVIYKTKMVGGPNRNFEIFDPLDSRAVVTSHIPNRGEHLVRYYGYYSSVQRGRRRRQGRGEADGGDGAVPFGGDAAGRQGRHDRPRRGPGALWHRAQALGGMNMLLTESAGR